MGPSVNAGIELALSVDARGQCKQLLQDSANLATSLRPGDPLTAIVDADSVVKTCRFLQALRDRGAAFDWELQFRQEAGPIPLHFAGHRMSDEGFMIVAGQSRQALVRLYETFASTACGAQPVEAATPANGDAIPFEAYDEVARLNNDLVNLQRDLARQNAHLESIVSALEVAGRQKDMLLARVAHDLRGPLSPIVMWTTLLREGRLSEPKLAQVAEALNRSTQSLARLIADLTDFAQLTTGKLRVALRPVDLRDALQTALDQVQGFAASHDVTINATLPEAPVPVLGDPDRLAQAFWNLLSNAVKASPAGARVDLTVTTANDVASVLVADRGRGISTSLLAHVFEPFRQAEDGTADGLGLGLAITRDVVDQHGGSVTVVSAGEGQGATFTVTLPLLRLGERASGGQGAGS